MCRDILKNKGRVQGYTAGQWGFPALFEVADSVFTLISEANVAKGNCGSWLNNASSASSYKVEMAEPTNVSGRWCSPWRVAIIGSLAAGSRFMDLLGLQSWFKRLSADKEVY